MKIKRLLAAVMVMVMIFTCLFTMPVSAAVTDKAVYPVEFAKLYYVDYTNSIDVYWLEFTLEKAGLVRFRQIPMTDDSGNELRIDYRLYHANNNDKGSEIWSNYANNIPKNKYNEHDITIGLAAGTYRMEMAADYIYIPSNQTRRLTFQFDYSAINNYETEGNNTKKTADKLTLNKKMNGYIDNSVDYYALTVTKDTLIRFKIGNYGNLYSETSIKLEKADGTSKYLVKSDAVATSDGAYFDVLLKKGKNYIYINPPYEKQIYYSITPSTNVKVSAPTIKNLKITGTRVDVSWSQPSDVSGYEVWRKINNGSWKCELTSGINTIGFYQTGTNFNNTYQFKVRAYKKIDGKKVYSDWSKIKALNPTPTNIKLSKSSYTYNGKKITPSVTIKDKKGKTLKKDVDYKISYASGRKEVGKYKVTITFKGNYSGKKTVYFKINPKGTSVSSVTAAKRSLKVKLKKQTTKTSGYQIQYSTSKKFSSAKTVTIKSNKTTSATLKNLKSKKTYYVRVRTYKTVKGTKYYSGWSSAKVKKTK